jgi:hypothetical protein
VSAGACVTRDLRVVDTMLMANSVHMKIAFGSDELRRGLYRLPE